MRPTAAGRIDHPPPDHIVELVLASQDSKEKRRRSIGSLGHRSHNGRIQSLASWSRSIWCGNTMLTGERPDGSMPFADEPPEISTSKLSSERLHRVGIYESLGLQPVVNADSRMTLLGGSVMPEPVLQAMREAARSHVDMLALQRRAGERLAELTRNEAAYVCGGAAAGLFLSTLACMTGTDLRLISRLPRTEGVRNQVIMHRAHRIPYDPAVRLAGAELVEIGNALQTFPWELEAAISADTTAVLYVAGEHLSRASLSLPETIRIAHAHGIPVVVDAAAQLPPMENLWHFSRDLGADLVIFSGGKDLRGPQASGLIVGRADLIEGCRENGAPHQRLARLVKVGKEEIAGLLTAVELYLQEDHEARQAGFESTVQSWVSTFDTLPGIAARRDFPNEAGQPVPRVRIDLDLQTAGMSAPEVQRQLWEGDPPIAVAVEGENRLYLTPDTLEPGEDRIVTERLHALLVSTGKMKPTAR